MGHEQRVVYRLGLALAKVCQRLAAPDFGELIDGDVLDGDAQALGWVMWGAHDVGWWAAQHTCGPGDVLFDTMADYRYLVGCALDGHPLTRRGITEVCAGLRELGSGCVFVQLSDLCGIEDALDVADAFDVMPGFEGEEAA